MNMNGLRALILSSAISQEETWELIIELGYEPIDMPCITYEEFLDIWRQRATIH